MPTPPGHPGVNGSFATGFDQGRISRWILVPRARSWQHHQGTSPSATCCIGPEGPRPGGRGYATVIGPPKAGCIRQSAQERLRAEMPFNYFLFLLLMPRCFSFLSHLLKPCDFQLRQHPKRWCLAQNLRRPINVTSAAPSHGSPHCAGSVPSSGKKRDSSTSLQRVAPARPGSNSCTTPSGLPGDHKSLKDV